MEFVYLEGYSGQQPAVYRYSEALGLERFNLAERKWDDVNAELEHLRGWIDPVNLTDLPAEVQLVEYGC